MAKQKLYRTVQERKIAGVCGGLAEYFDLDVSIVRVVFLAALLLAGTAGILYLIIWFVVPEKDETPGLEKKD